MQKIPHWDFPGRSRLCHLIIITLHHTHILLLYVQCSNVLSLCAFLWHLLILLFSHFLTFLRKPVDRSTESILVNQKNLYFDVCSLSSLLCQGKWTGLGEGKTFLGIIMLSKTRKSVEERSDTSDTITLKEVVSRETCRYNTWIYLYMNIWYFSLPSSKNGEVSCLGMRVRKLS